MKRENAQDPSVLACLPDDPTNRPGVNIKNSLTPHPQLSFFTLNHADHVQSKIFSLEIFEAKKD